MKRSWFFTLGVALTIAVAVSAEQSSGEEAQDRRDAWPARVLLTNDDGISETRLWALAKAFSKNTKTYVVANTVDRSGSSNYSSLFGKDGPALFVQREYVGDSIVAYGVAGYPADCVMFAATGLMKDHRPDLVVSGINGGANAGVGGWFGSGTIGAARMAALLGLPAIAVSGLDDDDPEMVGRLTSWVVKFAGSDVVRQLQPGQFLTVSVPRVKASEIRGVKFAERAPPVTDLEFVNVWSDAEDEDDDETKEVWVLTMKPRPGGLAPDSDIAWLEKGYVVVVPMRIDEHDRALLSKLRAGDYSIPEW